MHAKAATLVGLAALAACQQPPQRPPPEPVPIAKPEQPPEPAPALALPQDPITVSVHQRTREAIPGSQGTIYVRLDDITVGQVMLSMENARGDTILDGRSVRDGDVLEFQMGDRRHYLQVVKLYNLLFGGDVAELRVSTTKPDDDRGR